MAQIWFFPAPYPTYRFGFFQHGPVVFLFWVLILLIIFRENFNLLHINEGFVFVLVRISFLPDYSVIDKGIRGLSSTVYDLLGALALIYAGCCMYLSIRPCSFFTEFLLSSALIFKGTWILQTALSLYTDVFALKGCQKISMVLAKEDADVQCNLKEDGLRGAALMKLLFIGHAIGVLVLSFVSSGLVSSKRRSRNGEVGGSLLAQLDSQIVFMCPNDELDLELNE